MDPSELKSYEQQLAQVRGALESDRGNEELINLEKELENLIDLTKQLIQQQQVSEGSSKNHIHESTLDTSEHQQEHKSQFVAGDECQALYEADRRWYPARVVSVGGSAQKPMYTIMFKGYNNTEIVTASSLKPAKQPKYPVLSPAEQAERERRRKRNEKKMEKLAVKSAEANAVQNSWQKFAKKAEKKGTIKGDRSMFKTPDDPLAKVGVVGAGRGMTHYQDRKKHTYEAE